MTDKERRTLENLVLDEDVRTAVLSMFAGRALNSATVQRLIELLLGPTEQHPADVRRCWLWRPDRMGRN